MFTEHLTCQTSANVFAPFAGKPFAHRLCGGRQAAHGWGSDWQITVAFPAKTLQFRHGQLEEDGALLPHGITPFDRFKDILASRARPAFLPHGFPEGLPFVSGAVGHICYEMAGNLEQLPGLHRGPAYLPEMAFGFYDGIIATHRKTGETFVMARSEDCFERLRAQMQEPVPVQRALPKFTLEQLPDPEIEKEKIARAIERIAAGDIFQANITQKIRACTDEYYPALPAQLFAQWQSSSASPFMALLQYESAAIISNSPERFFKTGAGSEASVTAEPVKGTRPRYSDPVRDKEAAAELLADKKDRAENIMIADLMRNDLSRVCQDHSIREEEICALRSFATVHHLVSIISGKLRPGLSAVDVIAAAFPSGSITGAPKIRAMEIISELENRRRGIYCGAIGYIDDGGAADMSVAIRTAELVPQENGAVLDYGTGGGITLLSDPEAEYAEALTKAENFRRLLEAESP